ncbi:MAG: acyl carrier protein [Ilumatobacteraceae bacterium]
MTEPSSDATAGSTGGIVAERVIATVADVVGEDIGALSPSTIPADLEAWDSLAHLNVIMALEDEFGVTFTSEDIESMAGIQAIIEVLTRRTNPS